MADAPLTSSAAFPASAASPWRYVLLGVIVGTQFMVSQQARRGLVLSFLLTALVYWMQRRRWSVALAGQGGPSWVLLGGALLCVVNLLIMAGQAWGRVGWQGFTFQVAQGGLLLLSLGGIITTSAPDRLRASLVVLVAAFAWFGWLNLMADWLHLGSDELMDREQAFSARLSGVFRWQSPLYSAWQMSGLLRWAAPFCLLFAWQARRRLLQVLFWLSAFAVCTYVLVILEYRAAVMPLAFALVWFLLPAQKLRLLVCLAAILYPFASPFLFTSGKIQDFLIQHIPEQVPALLGQSFTGLVTLSQRSEIWEQGLELLAEGKYFWVGQGHYALDAVRDGYTASNQDVATTSLFRRISYHQAVLDVFLIYGTFAATILCVLLLYIVVRGAWTLLRRGAVPSGEGSMLALFCVGIVAVTNAHDGFFVEHNFFYVIVVLALSQLWHDVKRPPFRGDVAAAAT